MNAKIYDLATARKNKQVSQVSVEKESYKAYLRRLDKLELLDEMLRFQEERYHLGYHTLSMIVRGKLLFKAIEEVAETMELRLLVRTYCRRLDEERAQHKTGR